MLRAKFAYGDTCTDCIFVEKIEVVCDKGIYT